MITGTYERYWKTRTCLMTGAYAYRNTLPMAVFIIIIINNKKYKERAGNRLGEENRNNLEKNRLLFFCPLSSLVLI